MRFLFGSLNCVLGTLSATLPEVQKLLSSSTHHIFNALLREMMNASVKLNFNLHTLTTCRKKNVSSTKSHWDDSVDWWLLQLIKRAVVFIVCCNEFTEMCHQCNFLSQIGSKRREFMVKKRRQCNQLHLIFFIFVSNASEWHFAQVLWAHLLTEFQWKVSPIFWWIMEKIECCTVHAQLHSKAMCCSFSQFSHVSAARQMRAQQLFAVANDHINLIVVQTHCSHMRHFQELTVL